METATLAALAEPHRLRIVELLGDGPRSVNEVASALRMRQPQASKHLHTLSRAGLVAVEPRAQQRIYSLRPDGLASLQAWLGAFEHHWNDRLDRPDQVLAQRRAPQGDTP